MYIVVPTIDTAFDVVPLSSSDKQYVCAGELPRSGSCLNELQGGQLYYIVDREACGEPVSALESSLRLRHDSYSSLTGGDSLDVDTQAVSADACAGPVSFFAEGDAEDSFEEALKLVAEWNNEDPNVLLDRIGANIGRRSSEST